jgi:chaperonin GroES
MLHLDTRLTIDEALMRSPDLTPRFSSADLVSIGNWVWEGYTRDQNSRDKWRIRTQAAMDLALQVQKDKNFPWAGCANVAFPLVTIATLQFHSRAYPAIIQGSDVVKYKVNGDDPEGKEKARALRIGAHMSYQVLEEDTAWEEQHDRLLINIPIVGCAFKKTYRSGEKGHNISELVLAEDLVLDYYAKSVEDCARKTHTIPLYRNEIHSNIMLGIFRDVREESWYTSASTLQPTPSDLKQDKRTGQVPPQSDSETPYRTLEQHCWMDCDGDGYAEPYIVTIEENSRTVLRIVTRFDRQDDVQRNSRDEIIRIVPTEYFTKYGFIPSPDGGIYDIGFGTLLGPLNEATNSLVNQLIDAGTMATTAGGFLGRGAKVRGGVYSFAPLEWKRVDSTGDDLRKNVFPLPVREPSAVLFQLLSLLINYTQRIAGTTDTLAGENPGQNTPAQTTQTMVEQGAKIFNAIFKRTWRSMKGEFKKLYILNATYMPMSQAFGSEGMKALRDDYLGNPDRITPVADPNIISDAARMQQALTLKQNAMTTPGYDLHEVELNFLRAMRVDGVSTLYPGPDKTPPLPNLKMQVEQMRMEEKKMRIELDKMKLQAAHQQFIMEMQEEHRLNSAKIFELQAKAAKEVADASGVATGHQIAAFEAAIGAIKIHNEGLLSRVALLTSQMGKQNEQTSIGNGMEGLAGAPGNQGTPPGPSGMAGAPQGTMG